jgi:predicted metal-dependent hydrolase
LFNHGFYWEAHEAWEGLWQTCPRDGPAAAFFQGLIHLTAAGVKVREGLPEGVRSHAERAGEHFQRLRSLLAADDRRYFGLDVDELIITASETARHAGDWPTYFGEDVAVVFPFQLSPRSESDQSKP